jgi:hypothetical protein
MDIYQELKTKPYYSVGRLFLGELYLSAGEREKAVKNLKEVEESFQKMGMAYWVKRARRSMADRL